jgi:phosphoglycolate phosphatase-like HAD superfamily hydrolase
MAGYFREVLGAPADKEQNLRSLLDKYGLSPSKCCFFGDATSDYQAARACGTYFIGILPDADAPLLRSQPGLEWTKDFTNIEKKFGPNS